MSAYATPDDLAARWRPLTDQEVLTAGALLDDAALMLRAEYPGIDDNVTQGILDPGVLRAVSVAMVKRAMVRPDGVTQSAETVGPYSASQSFANPTGNLYITAAEDRFIRGYRPGAMSVAYADPCL